MRSQVWRFFVRCEGWLTDPTGSRAFAAPNASFGGTTFGQINNYASGFSARQLQIAVRYDF